MKMKKRFLVFFAVLAAALAIAGCKQDKPLEFPIFPVHQDNNRNISQNENQRKAAKAEALAQAVATAQLATVSQMAAMPHKTWVKVTGNITLSLGREYYTFQDSTGEITVEIEQKVWQGLSVSPDDRIEITGKVEHKKNGDVRLEAKAIQKL